MTIESDVISIIKTILKNQDLPDANVDLSSQLYEDGVGLDSLCVAELSTMLEKTYGKDPYTSGQLPQTVSDIVNFYTAN